MRKTVVTIVSLAMIGAWADESAAQELKSDALMGRWCTEGGAYVFTPAVLTVLRTDGSKTVDAIASIDVQGTTIVVNWKTRKGGKTSFGGFAKDKMMQLPAIYDDGSKSKGRSFHRC